MTRRRWTGRRALLGPVALGALTLGLLASPVAGAPNPALPNRALTPGATNRAVTPATIGTTICVVGYTARIRPPESYTERLKFRQLDGGYNVGGDTRAADYEEDHLIALEVGGSPTAVANLWPEPRFGVWNAARKDRLEDALHRLVCAGRVGLRTAQRALATNWVAAYRRYVG